MQQGIAHPPNSGHCCAHRWGLVALRRTEKKHAQRVGEGDAVPIITTPVLPSSMMWDRSEDCLGGRGGAFGPAAPRRASVITQSPLSLSHIKGGGGGTTVDALDPIFLFLFEFVALAAWWPC
jgi:hypothetical protein